MKNYLTLSLLFTLFLFTSKATFAQKKNNNAESSSYLKLSDEKFKEIETKVYEMEGVIPVPILLEGYSRRELVAFYIQSYSDNILETWMDFAFNKMHKFAESKPTEEQDKLFKEIMAKGNSRENCFNFMMHMTKEQIKVVGY